MKNIKKISGLLLLSLLSFSCSSQSESVWVRGVKTTCDIGAGKSTCLNVYKGTSLDEAKWENFSAPIQGFEFKEGVVQKIRIKKEKVKNPAADASSYTYTFEKVEQSETDTSAELGGEWMVAEINNAPVQKGLIVPTMNIDLVNNLISGTDGCNNYNGKINNVSSVYLTLGNFMSTKKMCNNMSQPDAFLSALNASKAYEVGDKTIQFLNSAGVATLTMVPNNINYNKENDDINNEWDVIRINNEPVGASDFTPHILISTSKKQIIGTNGCDTFSAKIVSVDESHIRILRDGSTLDTKICSDMTVPDAFNQAAAKVVTYKIVSGNTLLFYDGLGNEVLAFKASIDKPATNKVYQN